MFKFKRETVCIKGNGYEPCPHCEGSIDIPSYCNEDEFKTELLPYLQAEVFHKLWPNQVLVLYAVCKKLSESSYGCWSAIKKSELLKLSGLKNMREVDKALDVLIRCGLVRRMPDSKNPKTINYTCDPDALEGKRLDYYVN